MWPFAYKPTKEDLLGLKKISVHGASFVIKKLNPLLDFPPEKMPQIFSTFMSRRQKKEQENLEATARRNLEDMYSIVEAGVVSPELVKIGKGDSRGKEDGITVEDLFRSGDLGQQLYFEILAHSLNRFRGLKGIFFTRSIRRQLYTAWQKTMAKDLATSLSIQENLA